MYCNKCGRAIDSGYLCNDCAIESFTHTESNYSNDNATSSTATESDYYRENLNPIPDPKNRMYGFGKALTSTILGQIAFAIIYSSLYMFYGEDVYAVIIVMTIPMVIVSMILGIKSINTFKSRKGNCVRPIPTLILGINGLVNAAITGLLQLVLLSLFA